MGNFWSWIQNLFGGGSGVSLPAGYNSLSGLDFEAASGFPSSSSGPSFMQRLGKFGAALGNQDQAGSGFLSAPQLPNLLNFGGSLNLGLTNLRPYTGALGGQPFRYAPNDAMAMLARRLLGVS